MQLYIYAFIIVLFTEIFSQNDVCLTPNNNMRPSYYSIGDTVSLEDQFHPYEICYSSEEIIQDTFKLADFNGNLNGGNYKITLISINASW